MYVSSIYTLFAFFQEKPAFINMPAIKWGSFSDRHI